MSLSTPTKFSELWWFFNVKHAQALNSDHPILLFEALVEVYELRRFYEDCEDVYDRLVGCVGSTRDENPNRTLRKHIKLGRHLNHMDHQVSRLTSFADRHRSFRFGPRRRFASQLFLRDIANCVELCQDVYDIWRVEHVSLFSTDYAGLDRVVHEPRLLAAVGTCYSKAHDADLFDYVHSIHLRLKGAIDGRLSFGLSY